MLSLTHTRTHIHFPNHLQLPLFVSKALGFDLLPDNVTSVALTTYKVTPEQQSSAELDLITGFHLIDARTNLFLLEGLLRKGEDESLPS